MAMRTTLLPGLLAGLKVSVTSGWREPVRIFEQGRVFLRDGENSHTEPEHVAGLSFNGADTRSPSGNRSEDFYSIKADVEALITKRGYRAEFVAGHEPFMHAGQTADILVNGKKVGCVGRIKPAIEQELDVEKVYAFEIDTTGLNEARKPVFTPTSSFPASFRDISLMAAVDRSSDDVMRDIREAVKESASDGVVLEGLRLFDVYAGKGIPEGSRSLAYTLSYRSDTRTLTVEEVEAVHNSVRESLKRKGYVIR